MRVPSVTSPSGVELLEELGRGAHSVVYRARRQSRYFAVKMPLSPDPDQMQRIAQSFLREATALARVRHPALPDVMEVGEAEGLPYLVMELVAGETLASRLQAGPLDEARVVEMALPLAEALHRIHQSGLVHHDVSVTNILFDAHTDAIRLIDFGFARSGPGAREIARVPAPELGPLSGPEVDLFALGTVLFECVTALTPFSGVDPRPLLERGSESRELSPYISRGFAALLRRLMRLDTLPAYVDAAQFLSDLRNHMSGDGNSRRPPSATSPGWGKDHLVSLVGRERELDRLRLAWRTSRLRQGQIVVVRGASGTGKTRLLRAFVEEVVEDAGSSLVFKCTEVEREPFAWVRRLIHGHLSQLEQASDQEQREGLDRFRTLAGDAAPLLKLLSGRLARVLPHSRPAPRGDGAEEIFAEGLADFLVKLLNQISLTTVVIDDVQWLDPGSRQVLSRLTDRQGVRALFVLTARDDGDAWRDVSKLMRSFNPERVWELPLEPLDDDQIGDLIKAYLGDRPYDVDLLKAVINLSDRTPLGVLEMLRALLEGGALVPYWGKWSFHPEVVATLGIPSQARQILARRVMALDAGTSEILAAAAVLGTSFSTELLAQVCGWTQARTQAALTEARAALLVEGGGDNYRFVHDSVKAVLLGKLSEVELRALHQRAGEALYETYFDSEVEGGGRSSTPALPLDPAKLSMVYAIAWHLASGLMEQAPERVLNSCSAAGRFAFQTYDNELALHYWEAASRAAVALKRELRLEDRVSIAEAHLRVGTLETSIDLFRVIAKATDDPLTRAQALSRIAFVYTHQDRKEGWATLNQAFRTLGVRPPSGSLSALVISIFWWVWWMLWPHRVTEDLEERKRLELLGVLYHQAARLANHDGAPGHIVEVTLRGLSPAERLGSNSERARAYSLYSFVLTVLGATKAGTKYLDRADQLAMESGDPVVYAQALQVRAVILAYAGDTSAAVRAGARSLTEYGRWRELSDYCLTAYNQQQIDGLRGRNLEAWKWLELAIARLTKHDGPLETMVYIENSVRAALVALGREREADALLSRLRETTRAGGPGATPSAASYGADVRPFTESGRLDEDFEALVSAVRAKNYDPRRVHLEMTEYYVHVAHARVHACLRASGDDRTRKVPDLEAALSDLQKAARIPLLKAHALVVEGYAAFFKDNYDAAKRLFNRAQELGESEAAPWVMYAAHRGRAHLARSRGLVEVAQDQARLAESLAKEHRAAYRLRWIREEFELRSGQEYSSTTSSSTEILMVSEQHRVRSRAYLKSLVRIDQQHDLSRQQQAKAVIDELIETLGADRGFLFLDRDWPEGDDLDARDGQAQITLAVSGVAWESRERCLELLAARSARGADTEFADYHNALLEDLFVLGAQEGSDDDAFGAAVTDFYSERALLAVPLIMRRQRVGVVYLDRPRRVWPFSKGDRETLTALADQVPLVFELGRSLRARGRAEQTQRSAEKLEAIGRLAGGIAHDFNNMLSVIVSSTEQILHQSLPDNVVDETTTIQSAATRARDLTRQLLSFSRGQYLNPEVVDLNHLIERLHPIFQRLVGGARVEVDLSQDLCSVEADPAQIDQVLTNLVVNAGDAMTDRGLLRIQTRAVDISEGRGASSGLSRGRYARVVVSDTGEGMDEVTLRRVFEPFFTTKAARSGTGLGLATAYGIVTQSGGHITVESKRGVGTTFSIYLPAARQRVVKSEVARVESTSAGKPTILLVDDEPLVRKATGRLLRSLGYEVLGAESGEVALKLANERLDTIDLVLTDVVMPEMNGLDLARELSRLSPSLKVLFMSGFTDGVLAERGVLKPGVMYLQKPIQRDALVNCLNSALGREAC